MSISLYFCVFAHIFSLHPKSPLSIAGISNLEQLEQRQGIIDLVLSTIFWCLEPSSISSILSVLEHLQLHHLPSPASRPFSTILERLQLQHLERSRTFSSFSSSIIFHLQHLERSRPFLSVSIIFQRQSSSSISSVGLDHLVIERLYCIVRNSTTTIMTQIRQLLPMTQMFFSSRGGKITKSVILT